MRSNVMLILPKDDEALSAQRMERIPDRDFTRQNRGIMSPLQIEEDNVPPPCTRSWSPPG
jgi:hypothetical protein